MTIPYFKNLSYNKLRQLTKFFTEIHYVKGDLVYQQGHVPTNMFIVKDGQFQFSRKKRRQFQLQDPTKGNRREKA